MKKPRKKKRTPYRKRKVLSLHLEPELLEKLQRAATHISADFSTTAGMAILPAFVAGRSLLPSLAQQLLKEALKARGYA